MPQGVYFYFFLNVCTAKEKLKLIISYSGIRTTKDQYKRERGLANLEKRVKSGELAKANINNRGYNKYLKLDGAVSVTIDKEKFWVDTK